MVHEHSSQKKGDEGWNGTKSWDEAVDLLKNGYTDILPEIRSNMQKNAKVYHQYSALPKAMPKNKPVGYIPNVPNSIMNLPDSMICVERTPQKRKTLSVIYNIGGSASEDKQFFINAGTALCTALNIVEANGIQTQLSVGFMPAQEGNDEAICPTVSIKDFGQKFDLQKICFPLAHPSMFRRIGFKYLETCPQIKKRDWIYGYGTPIKDLSSLKKDLNIDDNKTFLLNCYWIRENNYDIKKILEYFKVSKEG